MSWSRSVFSDKAALCCYSGHVASLLTFLAIIFLVKAIFCETEIFRFIEQSLTM